MKVKKLIQLLEKMDPDHEVILSGDAEGNRFSPAYEIGEYEYQVDPDAKWTGEIRDLDEEPYDGEEKPVANAVVIWPMN